MKKIYILLLALIIGIASAFLAFKIHSIFYCLIPLWAFALGYFTGWRWGLLAGFLLFTGYTLIISLIHNPPGGIGLRFTLPYDYVFNFVLGGFSLLLIGSVASIVRKKGIRHVAPILIILLVVIAVGYCGYTSFPRYRHSYYVVVDSPDLENLEIYLPVPAIAGEPYTEIFEHPNDVGGYSFDLIETEHGLMLRVNQFRSIFGSDDVDHRRIEFKQERGPHQKVQLMPRYEAETVVRDNEHIEIFKVPLKIGGGENTDLAIRMSSGISVVTNVNFYNFKNVHFSDSLEFQGEVAGDEWLLVNGETYTGRTVVTGASGY